jgi:glycosyltransferase involved in cell wall biosynthesis
MIKPQKTLLFFSFYFTPDLSAGSFRNTTLLESIEAHSGDELRKVIITTKPNRYREFRSLSKAYERKGPIEIYRIQIPDHQSGIIDQIRAYIIYFLRGLKIALKYSPDLVYASTGRLFTGFMASIYSRIKLTNLFLDIRDIFLDTITDIYRKSILKYFLHPAISIIELFTINSSQNVNLISRGFQGYFFEKYPSKSYTYFTNGIDSIFLNKAHSPLSSPKSDNIIVYAGNIGEGQGLHIFIPGLAKLLPEYSFIIIGDGGAKQKLVDKINGLSNIHILPPMNRDNILDYYYRAKYTMIHLNKNQAFMKVLPSKMFELGAIDRPILAGIDGYASEFAIKNVKECLIVKPGDFAEAASLIRNHNYVPIFREKFKKKYSRLCINDKMAESILTYIQ